MERRTHTIREDGEGVMLEALARAYSGDPNPTSGIIEAQEARGQRRLVDSELLPCEFGDGWEVLERWGFTVDRSEKVDRIFYRAALPPGWKKVPARHSMWSRVHDEQGRERLSIFFKAAFYDYNAHMSVTPRYTVSLAPVGTAVGQAIPEDDAAWINAETVSVVCEQRPGGKVILHIPDMGPRPKTEDYLWRGEMRDKAQAWLDANLPIWRDAVASWDHPR